MTRFTIYFVIVALTYGILQILYSSAALPNRTPNGFKRNIPITQLPQIRAVRTEDPVQQFCGVSSDKYFYLTMPNPQWIIMYDTSLLNKDTFYVGVDLTKDLFTARSTTVDSPNAIIVANNTPAIYKGLLNGKKYAVTKLNTSALLRSTVISNSTLVAHSLDSITATQSLIKINTKNGLRFQHLDYNKSKTFDRIENNGILKYDETTNTVFFFEYFCNKFYCLDSNLNLLYNGHTIDTFTTNTTHIEAIKLDNGEKLTPANARVAINKYFYARNGYIYVLSGLKSDNEKSTTFNKNSVIDIYNTKDGKYKNSFYLPDQNNEKVISFIIVDDLIIALYKKYLATYRLPLITFE